MGLLLKFDTKRNDVIEAAERAMNGNVGLVAFIVFCFEDEKLLHSLVGGLRNQHSASLKKYLKIHVRKPEPRHEPIRVKTDAPLLLDVFTTKSDAAFNVLCDTHKAAETLLFNVRCGFRSACLCSISEKWHCGGRVFAVVALW